jgi:hypothetical protein
MASNHDSKEILVHDILISKSGDVIMLRSLPMGFFGILTIIRARVVGNCVIFTERCESGLDLIRFGNRLCYT